MPVTVYKFKCQPKTVMGLLQTNIGRRQKIFNITDIYVYKFIQTGEIFFYINLVYSFTCTFPVHSYLSRSLGIAYTGFVLFCINVFLT